MHSAMIFAGLAATAFAAPAAEANPISILSPIISGSTVSCSSGSVYCTDGSKTQCEKTNPGQTCTSGEVICCNSAADVLSLNLLPICGNQIAISIPVTVSALDGTTL